MYGAPELDGPATYDFSYGVEDAITGTNFGHSESRDGVVTKGSYYVALPDGRLQTVDYHADDVTGYIADVKYTSPAIAPVYSSPLPVIKPQYSS